MAYAGYLIRVMGSGTPYDIPLEYISEKSYKCTHSTLDLDPYRDANGILHRNAILKTPKVVVNTRPHLRNTNVAEIFANLSNRYISAIEKKLLLSVYIPELDDYYVGYFYLPDLDFTIQKIEGNTIIYDALELSFIGYGD